ncbi:MAG: hypothetical protein SVT52_08180 [Planctomycetota bacterium]|nr:hypothetical protein [Planctomycetota bacterium]
MIAWKIFYNPMNLPVGGAMLWLLLPLCVSVAVVYKTVRTKKLSRLPLEILALLGYMCAGLLTLGAVLWIIREYWP